MREDHQLSNSPKQSACLLASLSIAIFFIYSTPRSVKAQWSEDRAFGIQCEEQPWDCTCPPDTMRNLPGPARNNTPKLEQPKSVDPSRGFEVKPGRREIGNPSRTPGLPTTRPPKSSSTSQPHSHGNALSPVEPFPYSGSSSRSPSLPPLPNQSTAPSTATPFSLNPLAQTGRGGARSNSLGAPGLLGDLFNTGGTTTLTIQQPVFTERLSREISVGSFRLFVEGSDPGNATFDFVDGSNGQPNNGVFDPGEDTEDGGLPVIAPGAPNAGPVIVAFAGSPEVPTPTIFTTVTSSQEATESFNGGSTEFELNSNVDLVDDAVGLANSATALQPGEKVSDTQVIASTGADLSSTTVSVSTLRAQSVEAPDPTGTLDDNGTELFVLFNVSAQPLVETTPEPIVLTIPSVGGAPGANVGRQKLTENSSPIPRDRLIYNFSFFNNTPQITGNKDVSRSVFGFEKTFLANMASIELRAPFAGTLENNLMATESAGIVGGSGVELGNLSLYFKTLLASNEELAIGAGLGIALPTADDFLISDEMGTTLLRVENESPHLLPYIGFVYTPNPRFFTQGIMQLDLDTKGNSSLITDFSTVDGMPTGELSTVGRLNDADFVFIDVGFGYWLYRDAYPRAMGITGIAPTFELHYNASIDRADQLSSSFISSADAGSFSLLNLLIGGAVEFGTGKQLSLGYAAPVSGDRQFDGEFRLTFNWTFGAAPNLRRF